jgi:hypothetical protein
VLLMFIALEDMVACMNKTHNYWNRNAEHMHCLLLPCKPLFSGYLMQFVLLPLMLPALQMNVCTEVPAFQMQGAIMKRMAAPNLLNVVLAATALRLAAYAVLPAAGTPWAVLPVELLHVSAQGFSCIPAVQLVGEQNAWQRHICCWHLLGSAACGAAA